MKQSIFCLLIFSVLFSCTPMNKITYLNDITNLDQSEVAYAPYKIQVGDILHIKILGIQEDAFDIFNVENNANNTQSTAANLYMNGFTVNSEGLIEIPILETFYVKDLTIEEIKNLIQTKANDFILNATVIVKHINFEITILGEVNRPGNYTIYNDNITVFEAIGLAGDLTDYGKRFNIKKISGKEVTLIDITNANILSTDKLYLKPGDVLYVEPTREMRMRNSKAQIYLSGVSSIALIANIVLRIMGIY